MSKFTDFFWPTLEMPTLEERDAEDLALETDLKAISGMSISVPENLAVMLDEARRLTEEEEGTRSSLETRGGVYLATIGTLIPIVIFVADALTGDDAPLPFDAAKVILSLFAIAYLLGALRWSFKALAVGTYHRVGVRDVPVIAADADPGLSLTRQLLEALRRNRPVVNGKVTDIKLAEMFMRRSIIVLLLLLAVSHVPSGVVGELLGLQKDQIVACKLDADEGDYFGACKLLP